MKQTLQLQLGQHLALTPQLQLAIRLLQLSTLELQAEIQQTVDSNPLLELDDDEAAARDEGEAEPATYRDEDDGDAVELNALSTDTLPVDLPVDCAWEDTYDSAPSGATPITDGARDALEFCSAPAESLRDNLLWQLRLTSMSETDQTIATLLIESLNADGYLTLSLDDIQAALPDTLDVAPEEVLAVLHRVQSFDPPGIAARDLGECLSLQLRQLPPHTPHLGDAITLVSEHLNLLAARDYAVLRRRLKLDDSALAAVIALIRRLNPRPGYRGDESGVDYVIPDVVVTREQGHWRVALNPETQPRVRINSHYAGMVRRRDTSEDNQYIKNHLQEARWFIKSLQSRGETLLKVASAIVERQRAFLERGEEAMHALILRDIADATGLHESTISRVTTQKYMHTPRGVYEFKFFFSNQVSTDDGAGCSTIAIRAKIKQLVSQEAHDKPLSDTELALLLQEQGIQVARRTVAKYRELLAISPSNERRRLPMGA